MTAARHDNLEDWQWLVSQDATQWLRLASRTDQPLAARVARLRQSLSGPRAHLVLELSEVRHRARVKFALGPEMFFTRLGLQQATDQWIAEYKAARFARGETVADLGCGVGGDLLGLAARTQVLGVDRDPLAVLLAQSNCRVCGSGNARVHLADLTGYPVNLVDSWHLDPDRRPKGRRTTRLDGHEPGPEVIDRLLRKVPHAAVKLAPAAVLPQPWAEVAEQEWIGHRRECQQLVAWFGRLAHHPGQAVATVLSPDGPRRVTGTRDLEIAPAPQLGRYVFEPHATVRAAHLTGALAAEHGLAPLDSPAGYFTGEHLRSDPALAAFEVLDALPLDMKRLKSLVRQRGIGLLEVKKRGVPHDPDQVRRQLRVAGTEQATLILTRMGGKAAALLAQRRS